MLGFLIGLVSGGFIGVCVMALMQINKGEARPGGVKKPGVLLLIQNLLAIIIKTKVLLYLSEPML